MDAHARLVVGLDARGCSVATTVLGEAPLLMRVTDTGGRGVTVHLVGGAAGPLGGDRLVTDVVVGKGAQLTVRSVAASLAQPGRNPGAGSTASISVDLAAGATLDWRTEPLISVVGSDHTQRNSVVVADESARLSWVDEVVLGRHRESAGRLTMHQRITVAGRPVVHHTVVFDLDGGDDPGRTIGGHGRHRVAITAVQIGVDRSDSDADRRDPRRSVIVDTTCRTARLDLGSARTMWVALADDLDRARSGLAELGFDVVGFQLTNWKQGRDNSLVEPNGPVAERGEGIDG